MYLVIAVTSDDMDITVKSMMSPSPIPAESFTVLVVTADSARLAMMSTTLSSLGYIVLTASTTSEAISIAQNKQDLNLVLTDVHLPDMNKYEHLEKMKAVSNAPLVIMYDDDKISKLHSLFKESIFYILSSLTKESLKNLRKFAFNKNKDVVMKDVPKQQSNVHVESRDGRMKSSRVKSEEISDWEEKNSNDSTTFPKRRQVWTKELHQRFVMAVRQLGVNGAHPKQILELMKVTGLRRRCVASHLQKYRMAWRQEQVALQQTQIKASNSEKYQSYQYVPTSNFQGGLPRLTQLPNLYSTYTPYPQELHVLNNHNGLVHTTPVFGSAYNPIHLDSSGSEPTNNRNWQPTPRNQLAYTYSNAEHIGAESSSNKNLAADFGDMGSFSKKIFQEQNNNFSTEVFQEQNNFSSIVDNGPQNLTHFPVHHSVQQQPSLPPIQEQEDSNFVGETEPSIFPSLIFTSADYEQGDGLLELGEEMLDFDDINFNDLLF